MANSEPNTENKLFVGGCPPGSGEEDLRQVFEQHGVVEEIFIMRGGSRSGMACAFVRYETQEMAQKAIDAIHGQITLPKGPEPLVVRWADAPGNRRRESRERSNKRGSGSGRDSNGVAIGKAVFGRMDYMHSQQGWGMPMPYMQMPMQAMGGGFNNPGFYGQGQMGGGYMYQHPQLQMMQMSYQQQAAHMAPMMMQHAASNLMMPHFSGPPHAPPYAVEHMPVSPTEHAH